MNPDHDMRALALATQGVYERNAARFDRERAKGLHERRWLDRFLSLLPEKAALLDAGCGAGEPIAKYLIEQRHELHGIDYSAAMISLARLRLPRAVWAVMDMRKLDLQIRFDGIVAWHSFFHLTPDEQRRTIPLMAQHLIPGGALMLTVGTAEGEVIGHVADELVYHASLSPDEYRRLLGDLDMAVVDFVFEDPDCDLATVLLAKKAGASERPAG